MLNVLQQNKKNVMQSQLLQQELLHSASPSCFTWLVNKSSYDLCSATAAFHSPVGVCLGIVDHDLIRHFKQVPPEPAAIAQSSQCCQIKPDDYAGTYVQIFARQQKVTATVLCCLQEQRSLAHIMNGKLAATVRQSAAS